VHIVGNKRWNRRGAMVTDRYQHLKHHDTVPDLAAYLHDQGVQLLGIDNLPGSEHLESMVIPEKVCFLFGQEGPGLSEQAREACDGTFRSPSSVRPARSMPPRPPRSRCTPGSGLHADLSSADAWRG
jgi:rRNA methylases